MCPPKCPSIIDAENSSRLAPMLTIRAATIADAALLRKLIWELADFEKMPDEVRITEADIAEWDGQPAGYAVFFSYYSTWRGAGLFLEDLFVRTDFRGRRIGTALLARVANTAAQEGLSFMKWSVLKWNQPAIEMYKTLGAEFLDEWQDVLLSEDGLHKLAEKDS
jgi:GNAT superfamily N-acetyltransferase